MSPSPDGQRLPHVGVAELRRVCVFLADLQGGGAERMMVQLAAGIAAHGVTVDLVVADAQGPYVSEVPASVQLVALGRARTASAVLPLAAHLRHTRPDVLFTTLHHAAVAAAIASRLAGGNVRLFVREASTPLHRGARTTDPRAWAIGAAMRWVYAIADGVIAVSEGVADGLVRHRGVPKEKVHTLYNPVVTTELPALAAMDPGHAWLGPGAPPVVLAVGSLRPVKGYATLLEAFARVRAASSARLLILGEGRQRKELVARAAALGLADDVDFAGFVANPFAYMARSAVFVLSSEREGLPGALIQAMACGCPVVATDCPSGPAEILEGGRYGELVPVGDADAMAAAILRTLAAPRRDAALRSRAARFASGAVVSAHVAAFGHSVAAPRRVGAHGGGA